MGFRFLPALPFVHVDILVRVDWEWAIWIDGDQEQPRVCVDEVCLVSHMQIVDDRSFVKVREFRHIISLVELGWIYLVNAVCADLSLLTRG
jgi:hypothetical protein